MSLDQVDASSLPADWSAELFEVFDKQYWAELQAFLAEVSDEEVLPPRRQVFSAFHLTPFVETRVVILGQDPYPTPGNAHGLAFSVPQGVAKPRSLINIHKEMQADLKVDTPDHGNLEGWARQGVLLLNTALTVGTGAAGSHLRTGWGHFTDEVIRVVNRKPEKVVFLLWGNKARAKRALIDSPPHVVIEAGHPVARANAKLQFLGERPFSKANDALEKPIDWAAL